MESLAYSIIHLLQGFLPWQEQSKEAVCASKQRWSGENLCAGYPDASVFGEFVDYARGLQFQEEPAYAVWMDRFQNLSESGPADAKIGERLYNPTAPDTSSITVPSPLPSEKSWVIPDDEDEDYFPFFGMNILWGRFPTTRDQIGDEKKTVRRELAKIEKMSEMDEGFCCGTVEERILTWKEEDEDEEAFGQKYSKELDD